MLRAPRGGKKEKREKKKGVVLPMLRAQSSAREITDAQQHTTRAFNNHCALQDAPQHFAIQVVR